MRIDDDKKFMARALELAANGMGHTRPNPMVGAVLVKDGEIIGRGQHEFYGGGPPGGGWVLRFEVGARRGGLFS